MQSAGIKHTSHDVASHESDQHEQALEQWRDLVEETNGCTGYMFAVMAGLAAPLMRLVTTDHIAINFFGGTLCERRRILQLALSCWTDPTEVSDNLIRVAWMDKRTEFGFSYALHSDRLSVSEIRNAAFQGGAGMAILCGDHALDQDVYENALLGEPNVYVINVDVAKLQIEHELGALTGTAQGMLSSISRSYAGEFLMQSLRNFKPRIQDIRNQLVRHADYEYRTDLMNIIVSGERRHDPDAFESVPALSSTIVPRVLSAIKAIAISAEDEGVLPECQVFATISDVYSCWCESQIEQARGAMKVSST